MTAGEALSMELTGNKSIERIDCFVKKMCSSARTRLTASLPWNIPLNFDIAESIWNLGICGCCATDGFSDSMRSADISADLRLKSEGGTILKKTLVSVRMNKYT